MIKQRDNIIDDLIVENIKAKKQQIKRLFAELGFQKKILFI